MRIILIVTLISPDGEYGGPVRVALNQASGLIDQGHDVTIAGAARGFGSDVPDRISGVPVKLFPARVLVPRIGFAGLSAPGLTRWVRKELPITDAIHIHAARDLVTLPVARLLRRRGVPYVLQTHGMIDASNSLLARPLDRFLTRPVLCSAQAVFFLTERERQDLVEVAGGALKLRPLRNGVPPASRSVDLHRTPREVLFLARLATRKRPVTFVQVASKLSASHPDVAFTLVGPDEGEGRQVERLIALLGSDRVRWEGPLDPDATEARMAQASIYVLPAIDEPYPMAVLEAMAVGLPVVVTETCGLAQAVIEYGCGLVVDDSELALLDAVEHLLDDPETARRMGEAGAAAARDQFAMKSVTDDLAGVYGELSGGR